MLPWMDIDIHLWTLLVRSKSWWRRLRADGRAVRWGL